MRPDFAVFRAGATSRSFVKLHRCFWLSGESRHPLLLIRPPECRSMMKREIYDADHESSVRGFLDCEMKALLRW